MTSCELTNSSVTRWYISVVFPDEIHYYNYSNVLTNDELYKYEFAGVELVECDMTAQCMPETVPKPRPTLRMYHTVNNSLFLYQILEKKKHIAHFCINNSVLRRLSTGICPKNDHLLTLTLL